MTTKKRGKTKAREWDAYIALDDQGCWVCLYASLADAMKFRPCQEVVHVRIRELTPIAKRSRRK